VVELWEWTLGAGDAHASEAHAAGTKELLQVHDGSIGVEVDGQSMRLGVGDAVAFRGDVPHCYRNDGSASARFSLAVFEPGVGSVSRSESVDG
jgi:quercetin dioxygenase-like cupin family protein